MAFRRGSIDLDRRQLVTSLCTVGSAACLGCARSLFAEDGEKAPADRFAADSQMSYEQIFEFAFSGSFIPMMKALKGQVGLSRIQTAASLGGAQHMRQLAANVEDRTLSVFTMPLRRPNRMWQHVLTYDIVEDTEEAFEIKVTACLWARTFQRSLAADIGYSCICHPDFAAARAFNPKLQMTRDTTLMQGHSHCNHRWAMEA
jgi:hypothetical protein